MKTTLSIFFLIILCKTGYNQSINWKSVEFNIGKLIKVESNKNNEVFALSDSGLYKSKDNGITWKVYIKNKYGYSFLRVNWFSLQSHFNNGIITNEYFFPGGYDLNLINTYLTMYIEEADSLKYLGKFPIGCGTRNSSAYIGKSMFVNNKIYLIRWSDTQHAADILYEFLKNYGNPEYWEQIPHLAISDFYVKPNNDIVIYYHNTSSAWPIIEVSTDDGSSWSDNIIKSDDLKPGEITSLIWTQKNTLIYIHRFLIQDVWKIVRMPELKSSNLQYSSLEQDTLINIKYNESTEELSLLSLKYLYISNDDGISWVNVNHDNPFNNAIDFNISPEGTYYVYSSDKIYIGEKTTSIKRDEFIYPTQYYLEQNYPNPFNPTTNIVYSLKENGLVQLSIFNILGQKVIDLVNQIQNAGTHEVIFNGSALSSGIYIYQIQSNGFSDSKKLILIK